MDGGKFWHWGAMPPTTFFFFFFYKKYKYIYSYSFLQFCAIKLHLTPLNNIIDSFKIYAIVTNSFTIFVQIVEIVNSYWFASRPTNYITFLLTNNHSPHQ